MFERMFEYAGWRVLAEVLEEDRPFYVKEFADRSSVSYFAVNRFLNYFEKEGLLIKEKKGNLHLYHANLELPLTRHLKLTLNLLRLETVKLVAKLNKADSGIISVVLYGSWGRGENRKGSDLDIVLISLAPERVFARPRLELEKALGAEVELQVFTPQKWKAVKKEDFPFYSEVANRSILLYGSPVLI